MHVRQTILDARQRLASDRLKLQQQHTSGTRGIQLCARLSDVFDTLLLEIYEQGLEELGETGRQGLESKTALIPNGGYGRRDVAPYSDVDLLLLHHSSVEHRVPALAQHIVKSVSDLRLSLGFGVRTPGIACWYGRNDPVIFTSQAESRFLAGSVRLFRQFMHRFSRQTRWRSKTTIENIRKERGLERRKSGDTTHLLEPNVKRSKGCLRDIHLLRWVGFAHYGESDPRALRLMGHLSEDDESTLRRSLEFLLRLRNELHFHAERPSDVLNRDEQMRISRAWNYQESTGQSPVEVFMQEFFEHTRKVREIVAHFIAGTHRRPMISHILSPLVTTRMEDIYRIGPIHISVTARGREKLRDDVAEILHLMDLSNRLNRRIDHETWKRVRVDLKRSGPLEITAKTARHFMSLLSDTPRLGALLRRLHEVGVLEKLIVGMDHARSLLQFNRTHQYTVDEHSIRAVEEAAELINDNQLLGNSYRQIQDRGLLHLALLCHDMGKGYVEDHSDVGQRLAGQTAQRLHLSAHQTEILEFLVHKHLILSHLAFRRDTNDTSTILQFAQQVGSPENLRMLFVLTACDIASVGPGFLNPWKVEVLSDVFRRAMHQLSGGAATSGSRNAVGQIREKILAMSHAEQVGWLSERFDLLPDAYVLESEPESLLEDLHRLRVVKPSTTSGWGRFHEDRVITEYTVLTGKNAARGIFYRLTGALTSQRLEILSGEIHTLANGMVLDRFRVNDPDFDAAPEQARIESIVEKLIRAVDQPRDAAPTFRKTWNQCANEATHLELLPTRVVVDNASSPDHTIIDIFTHDRVGLLYAISRTLFELGLSVQFAKIGTHIDQVVDVFYVTDRTDNKVQGDQRIEQIKRTLLDVIDNFSRSPESDFNDSDPQEVPHGQ